MKRQQVQKQLTAHDKILIFDNLRYLLEGLEEYIEKAGFYPNFRSKRQLKNITIPKEQTENASIDDAEDFFLTNLILYVSMVNQAPEYIRKGELMDEYYKWIDAVGVDVNNCPEKLKQFLVEIKNVLEGNSERIVKQTQEYLDNKDKGNPYPTNPQDTLSLFGSIQKPLRENREKEEFYKGKIDKDVEISNKLSGNVSRGEQVFGKIASSNRHGDFHFYPQKGQQNLDPQQLTNNQVIQSFRENKQDWRIDEIVVEYDNLGKPTKKEQALIHKSAEIGLSGEVYGSQPVYPVQRFNQEEIRKINEILNSSQSIQSQTQTQTNSHKDGKGGGSGGLGGYGGSIMWGSITVVSLLGLAFVK